MGKRVIPVQFVDLTTGQLTMEAIRYLNDLDNGASDSIRSVGTILSGVNQTQQAIIAGTQPLADVLITGLGSVTSGLESAEANVAAAAVAASAGALTASANPASLYKENVGSGAITTDPVTITPVGGTGPYTYAWLYKSGYVSFSVSSATAATVDFTSASLVPGQTRNGVWTCTVTDSLAATFAVDVAITVVATE
jgi:hypothetical protein